MSWGKKDDLPPEKPRNGFAKKKGLSSKAKIVLVLFIASLLIIATAIVFVVMWEPIVNFFTSSAFVVIFLLLIAGGIGGISTFIISKIKEKNSDD